MMTPRSKLPLCRPSERNWVPPPPPPPEAFHLFLFNPCSVTFFLSSSCCCCCCHCVWHAAEGKKATKAQKKAMARDPTIMSRLQMPTFISSRASRGLTQQEIQRSQHAHARKLLGWKVWRTLSSLLWWSCREIIYISASLAFFLNISLIPPIRSIIRQPKQEDEARRPRKNGEQQHTENDIFANNSCSGHTHSGWCVCVCVNTFLQFFYSFFLYK